MLNYILLNFSSNYIDFNFNFTITDLSIPFPVFMCSEFGHKHSCLYLNFLLPKCQRMDVFHFKVLLSAKKPQQLCPVFKDKWLFRSCKEVCLKTLICSFFFSCFLIRKIKDNFCVCTSHAGWIDCKVSFT